MESNPFGRFVFVVDVWFYFPFGSVIFSIV